MNNLLKFIAKYSNFLVFLILEVVAFLLIVNNNDYPHSQFLSSSNAIAGWQNEQITNVKNFFALRSINESLAAENAQLRARLEGQQATGNGLQDTLSPYSYIPAKVVGITLYDSHNYITINKGSEDSLQIGQGVRTIEGVVGVLCTVNTHYSVVLPIINKGSNLSCRFVKNDYLGSLTWNGYNPDYAFLEDVAVHIPVFEGDTIVTSGLSPSFPEGILVGLVDKVERKEGDSYYTLRVKLATDFRKIKYVVVIKNELE